MEMDQKINFLIILKIEYAFYSYYRLEIEIKSNSPSHFLKRNIKGLR